MIEMAQIVGGIFDAIPCFAKEKIQTGVILLDVYESDA